MFAIEAETKKWVGKTLVGLGLLLAMTSPTFAIFPPIFNTGTTTVTTTPTVSIPPPNPVVTSPATNTVSTLGSPTVTTLGDPGSTVSTLGNPANTAQSPEPSSIVLGLLGLATLGGRALRRRCAREDSGWKVGAA